MCKAFTDRQNFWQVKRNERAQERERERERKNEREREKGGAERRARGKSMDCSLALVQQRDM